MDLMRCFFVVMPGALFWGASFPLALAAVAQDKQDPGRLVGTVYAANTVGAIIGAVFTSILGIALIGTKGTFQALIVITAISSLLMLAFSGDRDGKGLRFSPQGAPWALVIVLMAFMLGRGIPKVPDLLIAYGRYAVTWIGLSGEFLFVDEGMNSSMAVTRDAAGNMNYHNAGKIQASSLPQDMGLQRTLGHLTTLLVDNNEQNVLVIGCGAGVTAGAVAISPAAKLVTIAEIEPLVPKFVAKTFGEHNYNVIGRSNVQVKIDDGRHYLLTASDKFDGITSDPFDPWVKGAATLYTEEFWKMARSKLKPGGVITVFVQLYEAGMPAVKSEVATFLKAFPNGLVFGNTHGGQGYDVVLVGFAEDDRKINVDAIEAKLQSPQYAEVAQSLREINVYSAVDLFAKFAAQGSMLDPWLVDAQINKDKNLRLQYLAGLGVNKYEQQVIYSQMLSYRQFPQNLFTGTDETMEALRIRMMMQ
jgi:spermidine synthase